jgi:putative membrane protein
MRKLLTRAASVALVATTLGLGWQGDAHFWIFVTVICATLLYARGLWNIKASGRVIEAKAAALVAVAILAGAIATARTAEHLGEDLFSAHMAQHLTLIMICAPLFVLGRPARVVLRAVPDRQRRWLAGVWRRPARMLRRASAGSAALIWLAFAALFAFWHLPGPYAYAVRHEGAHIAEHLCLLLSAYAFWAVSFGALCRLSRGAQILYVTSAALLSALPGALISISSRPFYAVHAASVLRYGLTPLEDQQLAGLVMWIPAGFVYLAVILWLLFNWLGDVDRRTVASRLLPALAVFILSGVLAGCNEEGAAPTLAGANDIQGNPAQGAAEIKRIGCGSCHTIPGIAGATGLVGPPLTKMGRRIYVAGLLRNTPENLARWIRDPQSIIPGNAMPEMGISESQSRDIAAYLSTLK